MIIDNFTKQITHVTSSQNKPHTSPLDNTNHTHHPPPHLSSTTTPPVDQPQWAMDDRTHSQRILGVMYLHGGHVYPRCHVLICVVMVICVVMLIACCHVDMRCHVNVWRHVVMCCYVIMWCYVIICCYIVMYCYIIIRCYWDDPWW